MANNRIEKINTELQRSISVIIDNKLKDSRITGLITVLRVDASADLKHAKVFLSILTNTPEKTAKCFEAINSAAGFIRSEASRNFNAHTMPQLHFVLDDSLEHSLKINAILETLKKEEDK